jgi:hypothetical protein
MEKVSHFRKSRCFFLFALLCGAACLAGCASRFEKALEEVYTAEDAFFRFGEPSSSEELPDGRKRHEWKLEEDVNVPGQYVTKEYYLGRDRDGFPVYVYRDVWVPEHIDYHRCTLIVVTDARGGALERRWNGNSCDRLLFHSLPPEPRETQKGTTPPSASPPEADNMLR